MKINTNNATIIANTNAIKAIGTQIVVVSSSVSSFTSMVLRWRSDAMCGKRSYVERSVVETNVMGFISHYLGLHLAGLKPVADQPCRAYRMTQTCRPRTA